MRPNHCGVSLAGLKSQWTVQNPGDGHVIFALEMHHLRPAQAFPLKVRWPRWIAQWPRCTAAIDRRYVKRGRPKGRSVGKVNRFAVSRPYRAAFDASAQFGEPPWSAAVYRNNPNMALLRVL